MLSRWNRRTKRHDSYCVPVAPLDSRQEDYADEGLEKYQAGGFHPVEIGEKIHPHYRIIRRVGKGTFATIWEIDTEVPFEVDDEGLQGYVVKIMRADAGHMAEDEIKFLRLLKDPGHPNVVLLLDDFLVEGPFGMHRALVLPLLGVDLENSRWTGYHEAKLVARHIMHALMYIHSKGVMHTDLKMENILFHLNNTEVVLSDFGGAFFVSDVKKGRDIQSREYRAPEVLIGASYDEKIDIWSLGCIVYEVATRKVLFPPRWEAKKEEKDLHHLALISELMGPFPPRFARSGVFSEKYFDSTGQLLGGIPPRHSMGKLLRETHQIDDPYMAEFLEACLMIDPRFRPAASDLVKHYKFLQ